MTHVRDTHPRNTAFYADGPQEYAFGLQWFQGKGVVSLRAQAAKLAHDADATHYALRPARGQYGIASVTDRHMTLRHIVKPWRSAAAALADALPGTWVGAFHLADARVYVVAVINGKILTGDTGDVVFPNEANAQAHVDRLLKQNKFTTIYAPPEWRIDQSKPLDLVATLAKRLGANLSPARAWQYQVKPWQYAVGGVVVALSIAVTAWMMIHAKKREAQRLAAEQHVPPPEYWPTYTPASATLVRCVNALPLLVYAVAIPGFDNQVATCDDGSLTLTSRAKPQTPLSVIQSYAPQAIFAADPRTADIPFRFSHPSPTATVAGPLWTADQYKTALAHIAEPADAQPNTGANLVNLVPGCRCRTYAWTLTTSAPPEMWLGPVVGLSNTAITLASVAVSGGSMTWTIKGLGHVAP